MSIYKCILYIKVLFKQMFLLTLLLKSLKWKNLLLFLPLSVLDAVERRGKMVPKIWE